MSRAAHSVDAVLLDFDGTLIDSVGVLREAYARFLDAHGKVPSDAEFERWVGPSLAEIVAGLTRAHAIGGDARALFDEYMRLVEAGYVARAPLAEGAEALLAWLRAESIPAAIVTSAPSRLCRLRLERDGLGERFAAVVCGDDVSRGKPAPDGYLEALRRLAVPASRALAVEDSPAGVRAARSAGLRCVGLRERAPLATAGALCVVRSLYDVLDICKGLESGPGRAVAASRIHAVADGPAPAFSDEIERRVAAAWAREVSRRPRITDGAILSVIDWRLEGVELRVHAEFLSYRHLIAQREGVEIGISPLAVTAVTRLSHGRRPLVLGRRADNVTQYPGMWEFGPSGGVAAERVSADGVIDLKGQLLEELEEELGIRAGAVREVRPLGIIEDLAERALDACFELTVDASEEELRRAMDSRPEYAELELVPEERIASFLHAQSGRVVPLVDVAVRLLQYP